MIIKDIKKKRKDGKELKIKEERHEGERIEKQKDNRKYDKDKRMDNVRTGKQYLQSNFYFLAKYNVGIQYSYVLLSLTLRLCLPEHSKIIAITIVNI